MPELPDLEHIIDILQSEIKNEKVANIDILNPIVFRILLASPVEEILPSRCLENIHRHGPFVVFTFSEELLIVVHPMLAGRFLLADNNIPNAASNCFSMAFSSGRTLVYQDSKQMGKVYLLGSADCAKIPRFTTQGPDVISPEFTREYFFNKIAKSRKQVRVFLMHQESISAIGNAYADEILFHAGIHPKTFCYQLADAQKNMLYDSILEVIRCGINAVKTANRPLQEKVRDHVRVRNRQGKPCPNCGAKIRRAGVRGYDAFFCPKCQPPAREQFISWR
ncbi:MAG: Fpg/Nei family DNA glycosylase [bacterium]